MAFGYMKCPPAEDVKYFSFGKMLWNFASRNDSKKGRGCFDMMDFTGLYILLGGIVLAGIALIVLWLLRCAAVYRLAVNAGMRGQIRFLAWVPAANNYLLGFLCDRAAYHHGAANWRVRFRFRLLLPLLSALGSPWPYVLITYLLPYENLLSHANLWVFESGLQALLGFFSWALSTLALYHLYWDYAPGRQDLYTVLSLIFPFAAPSVCLFLVRWNVPLSVREPLRTQSSPPKEG